MAVGVTNTGRVVGTRKLCAAGIHPVMVAALMGHANIATTQIYTQPGEAEMARAVQKLR